MSKNQVEILYKCVVCAKAFSSKQALRGHMNAHRGEGYTRTSIVVNKEDWEAFKKVCEDHKTTTCSLMGALITATIKGEELGVINIGSENPAVIQVNQYFSGKPRGARKVQFALGRAPGPGCPSCGSRKVFTMAPEGLEYSEGRCGRCKAQWLLSIRP